MYQPKFMLDATLAGVLLVSAEAGLASPGEAETEPDGKPLLMMESDFRLPGKSSAAPAGDATQKNRGANEEVRQAKRKETVPTSSLVDELPRPIQRHSLSPEGPEIEVGALGEGRDDTPALAHLAFSWDF